MTEAQKLLLAIGEGSTVYNGDTHDCWVIETDLFRSGFVRLVNAERNPHGRRRYELTDAGINEMKTLRAA